MSCLLFSAFLLSAIEPIPSARVIGIRDFASLSPACAGQTGKFFVYPTTDADEQQGITIYEAWNWDWYSRGVYFVPGGVKDDDKWPMVVHGTIRVTRHPAWRGVPAWTEIRLEDAVQVLGE